jgi:hypothetical protein
VRNKTRRILGGTGGNVRPCANAHKMTDEVRAACTVIAAQSGSASTPPVASSTSMPAQKRQKNLRGMFGRQNISATDKAIAEFVFACGLPPAIARSRYFKDMIESVKNASLDYRPPWSEKLRTTLLSDAVVSCKDAVTPLYHQHGITGCTLCSDEWTNVSRQSIINFMLVSPLGAVFHSFDECSARTKSGDYISTKLIEVIEEIGDDSTSGKPKVFQVCTRTLVLLTDVAIMPCAKFFCRLAVL